MVFGLFGKTALLEESTIDWLYDLYAWSLTEFGSDYFYQNTMLVEPTDRHFPGRVNDPHTMADLILTQVKRYTGVDTWPVNLIDRNQVDFDVNQLPTLPEVLDSNSEAAALVMLYEPVQVRNPEVMIANFSHLLAHHIGYLASEKPPCDDDNWLHAAELVAVYLGFGLMLANTANPYRGGGCARCVSPLTERTGYLSEDEVAYALAIFSVLKGIPTKSITSHLKRSLVPFYKKAVKDVLADDVRLMRLKVIQSSSPIRAV